MFTTDTDWNGAYCDRSVTAVHEAGHAVCAEAMGVAVKDVHAWHFLGEDGETRFAGRATAEGKLAIAPAGVEAVRMLFPRATKWLWEDGAGRDPEDAEAIARAIDPTDQAGVMRRGRERAERLIHA